MLQFIVAPIAGKAPRQSSEQMEFAKGAFLLTRDMAWGNMPTRVLNTSGDGKKFSKRLEAFARIAKR
jgi:hypothetical protein